MPMDAGDVLPDEISEILGRLRRRRSDAAAPTARLARCRMGPPRASKSAPLRRPRSVRSTGPHEGRVRTHPENTESGHLGTAAANHPRHVRHRHGFAPAGPVLRFRCQRPCRRLCHIGLGVGLPGMWHMFRRPRRCWSSVRSREPIFALPVWALVLPVAGISCNGPCCGADWPVLRRARKAPRCRVPRLGIVAADRTSRARPRLPTGLRRMAAILRSGRDRDSTVSILSIAFIDHGFGHARVRSCRLLIHVSELMIVGWYETPRALSVPGG